jgi:hypothetical protein
MNEQERRAAYYDRVRPIIGDAFDHKGFAAYGLDAFPKAIEALLRTGARRAWLEDSGPINSELFSRALGALALGRSVPEAFDAFSRAHNRYEDRFEIRAAPDLEGSPELPGADVLLCYAPGRARAALSAARRLHIPAILGSVLEKSRAAQAVFVFDPARDSEAASALAASLDEHPAASPGDPARLDDFLGLSDLMLMFAKAILLRGTPKERPDLARLFDQEGRRFLVRGSPSWPWETRYLSEEQGRSALERLAQHVPLRYTLPRGLFRKQRVAVLGCGTASLLLGELVYDVEQLLFLDAKPFSAFNPIRQLCSTDDVEGLSKPFALQQILRRRLAPDADWEETNEGEISWLSHQKTRLGGAVLRLSEVDPESVSRFESLLDAFDPTLCIVGMGRSRDDNFTACEILRKRGIRHLVPTAFPGVTHFKNIVVDGTRGPCYDCLQNHLPVDGGAGPTLDEEARSVYYGGTQPATLAETYPSAHQLYQLTKALMLPEAARPAWWAPLRDEERTCLVTANTVERAGEGWLYGIPFPGQAIAYGPTDVVHARTGERCACGRVVGRVGG